MSTKPTINLDDSKSELWQWDTGRYLSLPDTDAKEVHISRGGMRSARVVKIQEQKAVIPDGLLVFGGRLFVYVVQANATGEMTVYDKWFDIQRRPKPDDYIYTDDEVRQWEQLEERLSNIESNGVVMSHEKLLNRDSDDQHPISAITGLTTALNNNSSAASEAMRAAQAAGSAASAAQDTANTAVKNADKAQQAADDAASVAQKAQTTAGNAQTAANRAQSTADAANATAEGLDSRITAAENELSQKQPAGDYLTEETDPTVPTWAKQPQKPTYTATEVGALPRDTKIPSKVSELENDEKYAKTSELPQIDATLKQSGQAADAAETGKRIEAISPDDSTIDGKPWSSKQIIDTLCPPLEETGNPVQCYPVAGYPLGVKAKWEPMQEGSGTPSPENIRPIKGRDSVKVERCGENLLNVTPFETYTKNGITYEYVPDGGIHISGTTTNRVDSPTFPAWHLPPGKYYGLDSGAGIATSIVVYRNGGNLWINAKGAFEILAGDVTKYWYFIVSAGTTVDKTIYPYIVPGTTAPTTYAPYIGQTNTLTLPETIYGGEVDAVTGSGQGTWKLLTLDGTEKWNVDGKYLDDKSDWYYVSGKIAGAINTPPLKGNDICSHYPHADVANNNALKGYAIVWGAVRVRWGDTIPDNADTWKTYLAAQYAAGTPVQVAYKLATPTSFEATGGQPIEALHGVNTVLTDADNVTVTGRADPIKRITDLEDAVASMTTTEG